MSQHNQFSLLAERRFAPFFWTQFLGALNDNVFKTALLTVLTFDALTWTSIDVGLLNNLIPGLFILPFVLFSASSGQFSDKYPKEWVARSVKALEVLIMLVAAWGWMQREVVVLIVAIVGMGLHSTLFGPMKYAYLPQHLKREELIGGNGLIEMGTFVGILLGEIIGAMLVQIKPWGVELVVFVSLTLALLGLLASYFIPHSPAPVPDLKLNWNPFTETLRNLRFSAREKTVFVAMLANSWFWFYGAIVLAQFPLYTKNFLRGDHQVFVLLLTVFSFGIGLGSLLCERLSRRQIEIGLVLFGSAGMSIFGLDLYLASVSFQAGMGSGTNLFDAANFWAQQGSSRLLIDVILIGVFGGFFVVPLFALIQTRCDPSHISRTIAGLNILNSLFMVVAALAAMLMLRVGLSIPEIFLVTAILNALFAVGMAIWVPEFASGLLRWLTQIFR